MITVPGATANTAGRVAARPAEVGEQLRAVSRFGRAVPGAEPWLRTLDAGALEQAGLPPDVAALHVEMNAAFNSGLVRSSGRTADATTPTTVAAWADGLGVAA